MRAKRVFRLTVALVVMAVTVVVSSGVSAAQGCDPTRQVTFAFDASTPFEVLSVENLTPPARGTTARGSGYAKLRDGSEVAVTAKVSPSRKVPGLLKYTFTGKSGSTRVSGTLATSGCLATVDKVSVKLARRGYKSQRVKEPALVSIMAVLAPGVVKITEENIGGLSVDPLNSAVLLLPTADPLAASLHEGAVVVAGMTEQTPRGLLRRVTGMSVVGSQIVMTTAPATLGDAFETLDFDVGGGDEVSAAGTRSPLLNINGEGGVDLPFPSLSGAVTLGGQAINVSGHIDVKVRLSFGIHVGTKYFVVPDLQRAHAIIEGKVDAGVTAKANSAFALDT